MTASLEFVEPNRPQLSKLGVLAGWLASALAAGLLAGCVTYPPLDRSHPMSWAFAWADGPKPVNIDTAKYLPAPRVELGNGFRILTLFSKPGGAATESRWTEGFRQACAQANGDLDASKLCHDRQDPDRILFVLKMKTWIYDGSASTEIMFVEPTAQPPSPDYQLVLQGAGFVPGRELEQRRVATAAQAEREEQQARAAWPLMRERGRVVCQDRDGVRYRGYVEDFTETRMKVSVSRAFFVRSPAFAPGGFRPEVIWTEPRGWFLCD